MYILPTDHCEHNFVGKQGVTNSEFSWDDYKQLMHMHAYI